MHTRSQLHENTLRGWWDLLAGKSWALGSNTGLTAWPWVIDLSTWCLSFSMCKMGIMLHSLTHTAVVRFNWEQCCQVERALDWDTGDLGSISDSATGPLYDLEQVTSRLGFQWNVFYLVITSTMWWLNPPSIMCLRIHWWKTLCKKRYYYYY